MIEILIGIAVVVMYLWGGQMYKVIRRYGVPSALYFYSILQNKRKSKKQKIKEIVLLSMIGLLSMGYGENSSLKGVFKYDWLVRIVYGLLLSIPLMIINLIWFVPIILAGAFSIRAGRLFGFKIKDREFDILIEDIIRSVAIFGCTYLTLQ